MNQKVVFSLSLLFAMVPLSAQQIQINKENKTIAITTTGDASAVADIAVVTVGFTTYGKDQDTTYADATRISNAIITSLKAASIPKDAIQSASQSLSAIQPNSDEDSSRYKQGLRFEFSQSWHVTVPADQASNVLHLTITSGANNSGGIDWQLKSDDALQAEAAQKALNHARAIAEHMAQGLGAKLGTLLYASNTIPVVGGIGPRMYSMASVGADKNINPEPLAISPNRITRSATVSAVFAIE